MTKLEELAESVAAATRDVAVSEALVREHTGKLRLAEEEASASNRRLDSSRRELEKAILEQHEAIHGKPVSFDDRYEFEKRWDARIEEIRAVHAERDQRRLEEIEARKKEAETLTAKTLKHIVPAEVIRTNLGLSNR